MVARSFCERVDELLPDVELLLVVPLVSDELVLFVDVAVEASRS